MAGMEIAGQCEIDEFCQKVLTKHWLRVPKWKDIKDVTGKEVFEKCGTIDLVSGGFPCQPFSQAGRRTGKEDSRYLWPEMLRVIREVRPRWVLAENVPGLLSISDGRVFGTVVRDLAESGYGVEWDCIPASAVGAPHQRDRIWIVAYSGREHGARAENETKSGRKAKAEDAIKSKRSDKSSRLRTSSSDMADSNGSRHVHRKSKKQSAKARFTAFREPEPSRSHISDAQGVGSQRLRTEGLQIFQAHGSEGLSMRQSGGVCDSASARLPNWCGGEVGQPAPITEFERSNGNGKEREIERDFRGVAHGVANRVDRLKLLGNGQVPQVVAWIGKRIMEFEKETPNG